MFNRTAPIIALTVLAALASCRRDDIPEADIPADINNVIIISGEDDWNAVCYQFDGDSCTTFKKYESLSDVLEMDLNDGKEFVVVSCSDPSAMLAEVDGSGFVKNGYSILFEYTEGEAPAAGSSGFKLEHSDKPVLKELESLNAMLSLNCSGAPEGFVSSVRIEIPGIAERFYPGTGRLEAIGKAMEFQARDASYRILPQADDSDSTAVLTFCIGSNVTRFPIPLQHRIGRGDVLSVSIDMSKAVKFEQAAVTYGFEDGESIVSKVDLRQAGNFENKNPYYNVWVQGVDGEWRSIEVRSCLCSDATKHGFIWNDWDNSRKMRDTMAIAIFDHPFEGPVKVRVKKRKGSISKVEVRPSPYGVEPVMTGSSTIEFTLPSYEARKVSVEFNKDRFHNLFLIGARPDYDKPDPDDPMVRYYGPGEWEAGEITMKAGETLYVDYGAVLYGNVVVKGSGCTIAGHGIISGEHLRHWGETYSNGAILVDVNWDKKSSFQNFKARDLTLIDSPSWTLRIFNAKDIDIDGINMVCWSLNGDGIDICSCHEVDIRNCLLRNYDDCITMKCRHTASPLSDTYNVEVRDCLIWNDYARGIVVGPEAGNSDYGSGNLRDILVHDCIILENVNSISTDDIRGGIAIGQYASPDYSWGGGTANDIENITFRDIFFDSIHSTGRNVEIIQDSQMRNTCVMRNILLENFTIMDKRKCSNPACLIIPNQHSIEGMTVRNFVFDGKKIMAPDKSEFVIKGTNPKVDITFE